MVYLLKMVMFQNSLNLRIKKKTSLMAYQSKIKSAELRVTARGASYYRAE
jgi:hypothetical protein